MQPAGRPAYTSLTPACESPEQAHCSSAPLAYHNPPTPSVSLLDRTYLPNKSPHENNPHRATESLITRSRITDHRALSGNIDSHSIKRPPDEHQRHREEQCRHAHAQRALAVVRHLL